MTLKEWRIKHRLTGREAAALLGCHWDTYRKIEQGQYRPGRRLKTALFRLTEGHVVNFALE